MVTPWAEKCSKIEMIACLQIFMPGRDLTDLNHMENMDTVIYDGLSGWQFLLVLNCTPPSGTTKIAIICLSLGECPLPLWLTVQNNNETNTSNRLIWLLPAAVKKPAESCELSSSTVNHSEAPCHWGEMWFFSPFVLGCFLHSSFHLYLCFVTKLLEKKNPNSDQQKSENYAGNELREMY